MQSETRKIYNMLLEDGEDFDGFSIAPGLVPECIDTNLITSLSPFVILHNTE